VLPNLQILIDRTIPITPAISGPFAGGIWTGSLAVQQIATGITLRADDGSGHAGDSGVFNVQSMGALTLVVPANASEGAAPLTATVSTPATVAADLTVNLASSDTTEATVPATLTIPAGQKSATFPVTIADDLSLDGPQTATITASSGATTNGQAAITVNDNETATLAVSAPATTTEGAGTLQGSVTLSAAPANAITVNLTSSDPTEVTVPAAVVLAAGQTSVSFTLSVVNDTQIDGTQNATITAHVTNWTDGSANIAVQDNENTNLTLTIGAAVNEGSSASRNVVISGTLTTALVVSLASDKPSRLSVPSTVSIPAGSTSATFTVTAPNNNLTDGTEAVTITAAAPGFTGTNRAINVLDNDVHHYAVSAIASSQVAGAPFSVTFTAKDPNNVTIASYTGTPGLTASGGGGGPVTITPTVTTAFAGGVWTGSVTAYTASNNAILTVSDGSGHTGASNAFNVLAGALHHFAWSTVASPQTVNTAFMATVTAQDAYNNTVTAFTGTTNLSGLRAAMAGPVALNPVKTGTFSSGIWTGNVTVSQMGMGITLRADDGSGHSGVSNAFDVVEAPSLIVTTTADTASSIDGRTSLREAITYANSLAGPQAILFSNNTDNGASNFYDGLPHRIELASQLPAFAAEVSVTGPGQDQLTLSRPATAVPFGLMQVDAGALVSLHGLTCTGGNSTFGGGINNDGTLSVTNSTLTGNSAPGGFGGGINNHGTLSVTNSTLTGNSAPGGFGGGIRNHGTLSVTSSTLTGNSAIHGGGIFNGGFGEDSHAVLTVIQSTLSGNTATHGGGISNDDTLTLIQSTLTGNSAIEGAGGGINGWRTFTVSNCIVAGNTANTGPDVAASELTSNGANFIGSTRDANGFTSTDKTFLSTGTTLANLLGPLADNGGPTKTHALLPNSPAINAGNNASIPADTPDLDGDTNTTEPAPFDQRGSGFERVVGQAVDAGAYEFQKLIAIAAAASSKVEGSGAGNTAFSFTISRTGATTNAVTVNYAVTGSGVNAGDFGGMLPAGTFTVPAGQAGATLMIDVSMDGEVEPDENFTVSLSNPSAGASIESASASSTITNDDSSTAVTASTNPSVAGQSVTFTAMVNAGSGTATGTVSFFDGGNPLGTVTLAGGSATLATSTLSVGVHGLTAIYGGAGVIGGSTGGPLTQSVDKAATTTSLVTSLTPAEPGQPVTFTATVSIMMPGAGGATGEVTFMDGNTVLGTGTLAAGQVSLTTSSLTTSTHPITAVYGGDGNFNASTSGVISQIVGPKSIAVIHGSPQSTTVNTAFAEPLTVLVKDAANTPIHGVTVTFTAPAAGASGSFAASFTVTTNASGVAVAPPFTANTTPGGYTVSATVPGGAAAAEFSLTNTPGAATHFRMSAPDTATSGMPVNFTLTALDAFENTATAYAGMVHFTKSDNGAGSQVPADSTLAAGFGTFSATFVTPYSSMLTATDSANSSIHASATIRVGTVVPTALQTGTTGILNRQTGLFAITVNVTNTTLHNINGFRLHVDYRAYQAAYPSLRLYNASSALGGSDVFINYPYPVAVGGMVPVDLTFYTSTRTFPSPFAPVLTVEPLAASAVSPATGKGVQPRLIKLANGTVMLEFPSVPARWYRVRYSADLSHWFDCPVPIQASGTQMQWIDCGAPFTSLSPADPAVTSRFYLLNEINNP
jgi:hypothetical protein